MQQTTLKTAGGKQPESQGYGAQAAADSVSTTTDSSQDAPQSGPGSSEIRTMYDGFGNKTETRSFWSDPLLQRVVLRTSPEGQKRAFVYGQNGDVKILPEEFLETAMTRQSGELAKAVGITEGRKIEQSPATDAPVSLPPVTVVTSAPTYQAPKQGTMTTSKTASAPSPGEPSADELRRAVQLPIAKRTPTP